MNSYNYALIPLPILTALERYLTERIEPGSFLMAVLENDLSAAMMYGDDATLEHCPALVRYLENEVDPRAWGNEDAVKEWLAAGRTRLVELGIRAASGDKD